MIVVTGSPRSGTSLMMLILMGLGKTVAGLKRPNESLRINNPEGTWELPKIVLNGLTRNIKEGKIPTILDKPITEDAIKLVMQGFMGSDYSLFEKIIVCIRDPREIVCSYMNLKYAKDVQQYETPEEVYNFYNNTHDLFLTVWNRWEDTLVVDYTLIQKNPRKEIKRIADFLSVPLTEKAVEMVKPGLYRSNRNLKIDPRSEEIYNLFMERVR